MKPAAVILFGLFAWMPLASCSDKYANLDPAAPPRVGDLHRMETPPESSQLWAFVGSVESWSAAFADTTGEVRLWIWAFEFPDAQTASTTYETSRVRSETGVGNYKTAGEKRYGGTLGLHLVDTKGVYFQYRRGFWLIVLSASDDSRFAEAVKTIPWAPRR
jgi:hypothetical protein